MSLLINFLTVSQDFSIICMHFYSILWEFLDHSKGFLWDLLQISIRFHVDFDNIV
jgi:hypothetical protein